jgi:hypothetical protein
MNKVIFVGFDTEPKAYEGDRALHDMHGDGTLYNGAVVVKEPGGNVALRPARRTLVVRTRWAASRMNR